MQPRADAGNAPQGAGLRRSSVLRSKSEQAAEAAPTREERLAAAREEMQRRAAERIAEMRERGGLTQRPSRIVEPDHTSEVRDQSTGFTLPPPSSQVPPASEAPASGVELPMPSSTSQPRSSSLPAERATTPSSIELPEPASASPRHSSSPAPRDPTQAIRQGQPAPSSAFDPRPRATEAEPASASPLSPAAAFDKRSTLRRASPPDRERAATQGPAEALQFFNEAVTAHLQQDLDRALAALDTALELDPGNRLYALNRERVLKSMARAKKRGPD